MINTPPFDPPYTTFTNTADGTRAVETLADGTQRLVTAHIAGPSVATTPASAARKAASPVVHGNAEAILYLDVPFAEKDQVKRLGAKWDGAMRKWYIPHGMDVHIFKRWWPAALQLQMQTFGQL